MDVVRHPFHVAVGRPNEKDLSRPAATGRQERSSLVVHAISSRKGGGAPGLASAFVLRCRRAYELEGHLHTFGSTWLTRPARRPTATTTSRRMPVLVGRVAITRRVRPVGVHDDQLPAHRRVASDQEALALAKTKRAKRPSAISRSAPPNAGTVFKV